MGMPIRSFVLAAVVASAVVAASAGAASAAPPPTPVLPTLTTVVPANGSLGAQAVVQAAGTYVDRLFPAAPIEGYRTITATMRVEQTNIPTGYFYATQFGIVNSGNQGGGYAGLQTRLAMPNGSTPKGAIFSIFGATGAAPWPGVTAVQGSESGSTFWSLRWPYDWVVGHDYRFTLETEGPANAITTERKVWMADATTGQQWFLGSIFVPNGWWGFDGWMGEWTELYSPASFNLCSDIQVSKVLFLGSDNRSPYVTKWYPATPIYPTSSVPHITSGPGVCTNSASIMGSGNSNRQIVGAIS